MHRQPVQGGEQALGFGDQLRPAGHRRPPCIVLVQEPGDQLPDDGGHRPVAPVRLGGQEGPDPRGVLEGQPRAGVQGAFFVQGQEFAQQG